MKKLIALWVAAVSGGLSLSALAAQSEAVASFQPTLEPESFYVETIVRPVNPESFFFLETVARMELEPAIVVVLDTAPRRTILINVSFVDSLVRSPI